MHHYIRSHARAIVPAAGSFSASLARID